MWWVKENPDHSRGGFQDRDVGKTNLARDFGPDYGVDYARFSDTPNPFVDNKLLAELDRELMLNFPRLKDQLDVSVKNGFVILKGEGLSEDERTEVVSFIRRVEGVREVINQLAH